MEPDAERPQSPGQRMSRARARAAVSASWKTGSILPRWYYELADADVPPEATDEFQPGPYSIIGNRMRRHVPKGPSVP